MLVSVGVNGFGKSYFLGQRRAVRRILIAAIGIHFFVHLTGIDAIVFYRIIFTSDDEGTGNDHLTRGTMGLEFGLRVTKIICTMAASFLVDKVGRRSLLLTKHWGNGYSSISIRV